jgi:hypothetical protein
MNWMPKPVRQVLPNECVRCSVATLFGFAREEVPNFMDAGEWYGPLKRWLDERGYEMTILDHTLEVHEEYYLGQGVKGDAGHCVVMRNGKIFHDPSGIGIDKFESWIVIRQTPSYGSIDPTFYASLLPALKDEARQHGYALALHGSLQRDMDLIAVPWVENAASEKELVEAICKRANAFPVAGDSPKKKPHGRSAWSLYFGGHPYIDLCVMPIVKQVV